MKQLRLSGLVRGLTLAGLLLISAPALHAADADWENAYATLLNKYGTGSGVRYAAWKANDADRKAMKQVTEQIAKDPLPSGKEAKIATSINIYNAWVLEKVLDGYPTKSVRDLGALFGFFTRKDIEVAGEKTSLKALEDNIRAMGEPRVHFALNCASASCPLLAKVPYEGAKLDAQLDKQATTYLNGDEYGLKVEDGGKKIAVSKIFDWYKDDFKKLGGTIAIVKKYHKGEVADSASVSIMEYDWSLNDAK